MASRSYSSGELGGGVVLEGWSSSLCNCAASSRLHIIKKQNTVSKAVAAVSHYYTGMTQHIISDVNESDSSCCVCNNDYK